MGALQESGRAAQENVLANDGFDHGKKKLSIKRKMLKVMLNQKYLEFPLSRL